MRNKNLVHPSKNRSTTVDPIRSMEAVESIKSLLSGHPRNYLLFIIAINNGLRIGDLLSLRVGDVRGKKPDDLLVIKESKTGKKNILAINDSVYRALNSYLSSTACSDSMPLFKSQKGHDKPLTVSTVSRMVKRWCALAELEGNYGAHSLRKTFGYIQRVHFGVGFEVLCKRFNHSSPSVTMRYLGVSDGEVVCILKNEI